MMTVRFASGFSVQYNNANYALRHDAGYTDLYNERGGYWIAQVPNSGCVIEVEEACRAYNPVQEPADLVDAMLKLINQRPWLPALRKLKRALKDYDGRAGTWRSP